MPGSRLQSRNTPGSAHMIDRFAIARRGFLAETALPLQRRGSQVKPDIAAQRDHSPVRGRGPEGNLSPERAKF